MSQPVKRQQMLLCISLFFIVVIAEAVFAADEPLPFTHKVEVYRDKEGDISAFSLRLEQPFLAEEFERNNYLRLAPLDQNAYLVYPKEARFVQKHAEFYGRLRGQGATRVRLTYEVVSENPDGSRRVDMRQGDIELPIPAAPTGPVEIYKTWARQQNIYIHDLLKIYPHETFFQYVLLQSAQRHGVTPPALPSVTASASDTERPLYEILTGSLAVQETLQATTLRGNMRSGDLNFHISGLAPPRLRSLPYEKLLEERIKRDGREPSVPQLARLVPEDRYFLHFNTIATAGELLDLTDDWGNNLLRLATVQARDHGLQTKLEAQLAVERGPLTSLFADKVLSEMAVVGADPFVLEGSDVSLILKVRRRELFEKSLEMWLEKARQKHPELTVREFNYRGHKVHARYTLDRLVSSFVAWHEDHVIVSNSHRAVRDILDAATGMAPRLSDALDFRYVVAMLPPSGDANAAYLYVSEACLRRLVGPEAKISEKRRMECFNNLVMLNNASLFYRLENGRSPDSLTDLAAGRFADTGKIICPHGGAYAWDAKHDACTCSLHNRLRYLTPNLELSVLTTSDAERREYEGYKLRYEGFWGTLFDPIAVRITVGPSVRLETCVLPTAPGSIYHSLRGTLDAKPRALDTSRVAPSTVASWLAVPGRSRLADFLRKLPGTAETLAADPTLTDLSWLGDRVELHYCDASTIVEVDPSRLRKMQVPLVGEAPLPLQSMVAAAVWSIQVPMYLAIDVEDKEKAARMLEQLAERLFLESNQALGFPISLDAYRLPDYKEHAVYVFSYQLYAVKVRLHAALVGEQLVVATRPHVLHEVIDAAAAPRDSRPLEGHLLLRLNGRALVKMYDDLDLYWSERSRLACNRNTISIYNLVKLYDVSIEKAGQLSQSKYGVRHFCPDGGEYHYEADRDQVICSVHGNRRHSRQRPELGGSSSFAQLLAKIDRVTALLRFEDEALMATVEISRRQAKE